MLNILFPFAFPPKVEIRIFNVVVSLITEPSERVKPAEMVALYVVRFEVGLETFKTLVHDVALFEISREKEYPPFT